MYWSWVLYRDISTEEGQFGIYNSGEMLGTCPSQPVLSTVLPSGRGEPLAQWWRTPDSY